VFYVWWNFNTYQRSDLSFFQTIQGTVAHEVLHCLGFRFHFSFELRLTTVIKFWCMFSSHEHQRYDRDKFLTIDWRNVDPQSMDNFQKDDPYQVNPFCIQYDYESIMHYDCFVNSFVYLLKMIDKYSENIFRLELKIQVNLHPCPRPMPIITCRKSATTSCQVKMILPWSTSSTVDHQVTFFSLNESN